MLAILLSSCGSTDQRSSAAREDASASPDSGSGAADGGKESDAAPPNETDASSAGNAGETAGTGGASGDTSSAGTAAAGAAGSTPAGGASGAAGAPGAGAPAAGSSGSTAGTGGASGNAGGPATVCQAGSTQPCYGGPNGTRDVGICHAGVETCKSDGTGYDACSGEVRPASAENCATAEDDDCDGVALETGAGCLCAPASTRPCYDGPANTRDVGMCHSGMQTCAADGKSYGGCQNQQLPAAENCATPADDDCNGVPNDTCSCQPGQVRACYSAPPATQNVGACRGGQQTCNTAGSGFGPCVGEVVPQAETCDTPADDDCDGATNESGAGCVCVPNSTAPCYTGPQGTQNVGACTGGQHTCNAAGTAYGPCTGEVLPQAETCNTPADDDCDGSTNESGAGCVCVPNSTAACYTGPGGTQGVGACRSGQQTCNAAGTAYGACTGEVLPAAGENCNTAADDNCNGQANEGCTVTVGYAASVRPILQTHCSPCHTTSGFGGANLATDYSGTQLPSTVCSGLTKGACALVRIQNGSMPQGRGCTGNPTTDANNSACLSAAEQATIQSWISGGQEP